MTTDNILSALDALPVSEMTREEWIAVGMALKEEGYPCSAWDEWSQNDSRYHKNECSRLWEGFRGSENPVKGGTIIQMARERGWAPPRDIGEPMGWNDAIEYDGDDFGEPEKTPAEELIEYLETLFDDGDLVGYVTETWQNEDGKWMPQKGAYDRTAGDLIASLRNHPDDIGATVGDWNSEAGAWIRFNPLDGEGVKNENVTEYRYALVESDKQSLAEQEFAYRKLELPIAALVYSGGKSLHAIVRIDAPDRAEYDKRVRYLYKFLGENGVEVDKQNSNPSRLSRMPGVTRDGKRQRLIATNIGRKSWEDWLDFAEGAEDELPDMVSLADYVGHVPPPPEQLIEGILYCGHKMLVSGPSKAGKSYLLMELCIALAEGVEWLGFKCKKSKVLYINAEIDPNSAIRRMFALYEAHGLKPDHAKDIIIWNIRGRVMPMDKLTPKLIRRIKDRGFDAVILDPIYKVITGDENSASEMGEFCNYFDQICAETGCASIYCHHHSKGAQEGKTAMDRASGSGVFARDPDAQLDLIELALTDDIINNVADGNATAWRMEPTLREFPKFRPVDLWFECLTKDHPYHRRDTSGELADLEPGYNSARKRAKKNNGSGDWTSKLAGLDTAFEACSFGGETVTIKGLAEYLQCNEKTIRGYLEKSGKYNNMRGVVTKSKRETGNSQNSHFP